MAKMLDIYITTIDDCLDDLLQNNLNTLRHLYTQNEIHMVTRTPSDSRRQTHQKYRRPCLPQL